MATFTAVWSGMLSCLTDWIRQDRCGSEEGAATEALCEPMLGMNAGQITIVSRRCNLL